MVLRLKECWGRVMTVTYNLSLVSETKPNRRGRDPAFPCTRCGSLKADCKTRNTTVRARETGLNGTKWKIFFCLACLYCDFKVTKVYINKHKGTHLPENGAGYVCLLYVGKQRAHDVFSRRRRLIISVAFRNHSSLLGNDASEYSTASTGRAPVKSIEIPAGFATSFNFFCPGIRNI